MPMPGNAGRISRDRMGTPLGLQECAGMRVLKLMRMSSHAQLMLRAAVNCLFAAYNGQNGQH